MISGDASWVLVARSVYTNTSKSSMQSVEAELNYAQSEERVLTLPDGPALWKLNVRKLNVRKPQFRLWLTNMVVKSKDKNSWERPFMGTSLSCSRGTRGWNREIPHEIFSPADRDYRYGKRSLRRTDHSCRCSSGSSRLSQSLLLEEQFLEF